MIMGIWKALKAIFEPVDKESSGFDVAFSCFSAIQDKNTCSYCKRLDGTYFLPTDPFYTTPKYNPPFKECKGKHGCRCLRVDVSKAESGNEKTIELLKASGGRAKIV